MLMGGNRMFYVNWYEQLSPIIPISATAEKAEMKYSITKSLVTVSRGPQFSMGHFIMNYSVL